MPLNSRNKKPERGEGGKKKGVLWRGKIGTTCGG